MVYSRSSSYNNNKTTIWPRKNSQLSSNSHTHTHTYMYPFIKFSLLADAFVMLKMRRWATFEFLLHVYVLRKRYCLFSVAATVALCALCCQSDRSINITSSYFILFCYIYIFNTAQTYTPHTHTYVLHAYK